MHVAASQTAAAGKTDAFTSHRVPPLKPTFFKGFCASVLWDNIRRVRPVEPIRSLPTSDRSYNT